jgi:hypothetical protein
MRPSMVPPPYAFSPGDRLSQSPLCTLAGTAPIALAAGAARCHRAADTTGRRPVQARARPTPSPGCDRTGADARVRSSRRSAIVLAETDRLAVIAQAAKGPASPGASPLATDGPNAEVRLYPIGCIRHSRRRPQRRAADEWRPRSRCRSSCLCERLPLSSRRREPRRVLG